MKGLAIAGVLIFALALSLVRAAAQQTIDNVSVPSAVATSAASVAGALAAPSITPLANGKTHVLVGCFVAAANNAATSAVDSGTCNGSANWTNIPAASKHTATTPTNLDLETWYCPQPSTGAHVVTVTNGTTTTVQTLVVMDVSGVTTTPLDKGNIRQNGSASTNLANGTIAVANPVELIIACGATAVSEASHASFATSPSNTVSDVLGVAPSLFTLSEVAGVTVQDNGALNYGGGWSGMATSTTSLGASSAFISAVQPTVVIDPAITNGNTSINVTAQSISGLGPITTVTLSDTASTSVCNRLSLCSVNSTFVSPICGAVVSGDTSGCNCTLALGPTTFSLTAAQLNANCTGPFVPYGCCTGTLTGTCVASTGSKAVLLCSGCTTNNPSCNFGTTVTDGFATSDAFVEPSARCLTDGTAADATATSTAPIISVTTGDMLLYDACAPHNFASGYWKLIIADTWNAASGDGSFGQLTDFYPVTATGTAPAEVVQNGLTNGAIGVLSLSAAMPTPVPGSAASSRSSSAMSRRGH